MLADARWTQSLRNVADTRTPAAYDHELPDVDAEVVHGVAGERRGAPAEAVEAAGSREGAGAPAPGRAAAGCQGEAGGSSAPEARGDGERAAGVEDDERVVPRGGRGRATARWRTTARRPPRLRHDAPPLPIRPHCQTTAPSHTSTPSHPTGLPH